MKAYIASSKAISAQNSFKEDIRLQSVNPPSLHMHAIEPDYKEFIHPLKLRRMNRLVKMGLAAALGCLKDVGLESPDAIITTTGWGCLVDTFRFLDEIIEKQEQTLSPATFIQSTHNTVGGQIALMLECQNYNSVYVNDSSSFEQGLLDALLLLEEGKNSVLIGGLDELTETFFALKESAGYWKTVIDTPILSDSRSSGTLAGEGAAFFLMAKHPGSNSFVCVKDVNVSLNENAQKAVNDILNQHHLKTEDIDIVISGINGDHRTNQVYLDLLKKFPETTTRCYYKHLTGEFDSASAFSLWLADQIFRTQTIPEYIKINKMQRSELPVNHILIHHFKYPSEHAFILVSKAGI
jgi:3-oxoacyl-[acyl-carrier-protein] synthase II